MIDEQRASWVARLKSGEGTRHTWRVLLTEIPSSDIPTLLNSRRPRSFDEVYVNVICEPDLEGSLVVVNPMDAERPELTGYSALIREGGSLVYIEESRHHHSTDVSGDMVCASENVGTYFSSENQDNPDYQATVEHLDAFLSMAAHYGKPSVATPVRFR